MVYIASYQLSLFINFSFHFLVCLLYFPPPPLPFTYLKQRMVISIMELVKEFKDRSTKITPRRTSSYSRILLAWMLLNCFYIEISFLAFFSGSSPPFNWHITSIRRYGPFNQIRYPWENIDLDSSMGHAALSFIEDFCSSNFPFCQLRNRNKMFELVNTSI